MAPRSTPSCALSRHPEDIPEERPRLLLLTPLSDPICQVPCYTHPCRVLSPPSDVAHREPRANRVGHPGATLRSSDCRIQPMLTVPSVTLCPSPHRAWPPQAALSGFPTGDEPQAFLSVFFNRNKVLDLCFVSCVFLGVWG